MIHKLCMVASISAYLLIAAPVNAQSVGETLHYIRGNCGPGTIASYEQSWGTTREEIAVEINGLEIDSSTIRQERSLIVIRYPLAPGEPSFGARRTRGWSEVSLADISEVFVDERNSSVIKVISSSPQIQYRYVVESDLDLRNLRNTSGDVIQGRDRVFDLYCSNSTRVVSALRHLVLSVTGRDITPTHLFEPAPK